MEIIPMLATEWKWRDNTHLELTLDPRAEFSTGEKLTADDVVFTFNRAMNKDPKISIWAGVLNNVASVEVIDEHHVLFTLKKPDNDFLYTLNARGLSIQSKKAYEDPSIDKPYLIGTGRYNFESSTRGVETVFKKKNKYWKDEAGVADKIIFRPMNDSLSRAIALENAEVDVAIELAKSDIEALKKNNAITVYERDGSRLFYLGFNCSRPPFNNQKLRQAVSCAIDKEFIISSVLDGRAKAQTTILNRGNWSFLENDQVDGYTYDIDRAKKLLAESGYDVSKPINLYTSSSDLYPTVAQVIQENLKKIGLTVNIRTFDDASLKLACSSGDQDMFLWRWNVMGRIDECFRDLYYTNSPSNYHHYSSKRADELIDAVQTTADTQQRLDLSHELQRYLVEEAVQVPLYVPNLVIAFNKNLDGAILYGGGQHDWSRAYVK